MTMHRALPSAPPNWMACTRCFCHSHTASGMSRAERSRIEEPTSPRPRAGVVSGRFRKLLPELARRHRLARHEYRVTHRPPENASGVPRVQVGSTRSGVVMTPTDNGTIPWSLHHHDRLTAYCCWLRVILG